jgi:diguanylate cyclase (GGDEF)-like protein/PAS domain S-box-containing protein
MPKRTTTQNSENLKLEYARACKRLEDVESTLRAIQSGQVDAIMAPSETGGQLLTLGNADSAYRSLVEGMGEGIVMIDRDGVILYCNQRFAEIVHAPLGSIVSSGIEKWIVSSDWLFFSALQKRADNGFGRGEITLRGAGLLIPTQISINSVQFDGKKVFACMVADLTAQKLALLVLEQTTEAILVCDDKGVIIRASAAALALHPDDLIGQTFCRVFPLQLADGAAFDINSVFEGERLQCEAKLAHGDEFSYFLVTAGPLSSKQHDLLGAIITLRDITERKKAEGVLRLRERALEASTEAIFIAKCGVGSNIIEYVNPAFESITGLPASAVLGKDLLTIERGLCAMPGLDSIVAALREHQPGHAITHNTRPDGSQYWSDLHVAPVSDEHGVTTHFVGMQNDISESMAHQNTLEHQANHDALTGLPNRNLLNQRLQHAISSATRGHYLMALVFVDLDHFKFVNDTLGHDVGDIVLTTIATRLSSCLRDGDTAARPGGDEFILILVEQESTESISVVIRRLLEVIAQPIQINQQSLQVSCSIGISLYHQDGDNASTLLKNADTAMYHAKESGRNNFQFFNNEMNLRVHERFLLESNLRLAMAANSLTLAYQPQIDIVSGKVIGVEALLRWNHAQLGLVGPARFIPIAEESGLIISLGEWVLRTACAQARAWQDAGLPMMTMGVNLSARQFKHRELADMVATVLAETGLPAQCLELELTESLALEDSTKFMQTMTSLKSLGLQLAIDDFGTGYSSLSYLKQLPLDRLKIDISFVHDIVENQGDAAIAQIIILLGHSLHLKVIAEGVETDAQLSLLRSQGCDEMQGFFCSEPLGAIELEKFLQTPRNSGDWSVSH